MLLAIFLLWHESNAQKILWRCHYKTLLICNKEWKVGVELIVEIEHACVNCPVDWLMNLLFRKIMQSFVIVIESSLTTMRRNLSLVIGSLPTQNFQYIFCYGLAVSLHASNTSSGLITRGLESIIYESLLLAVLMPVTQDAAEVRRRLSNLKCNFYLGKLKLLNWKAAAAKSHCVNWPNWIVVGRRAGKFSSACVFYGLMWSLFSLNSLSLAAEEARIPTPRWSKDNHLFKVRGQL